MSFSTFFVFFSCAVLVSVAQGEVILQAENGEGFPADHLRDRSEAADNRSVWLTTADQYVEWMFCLDSEDNVTVDNVRFSMDAWEKEVAVLIDGVEVGTFIATDNSNSGLNWNVFMTTTVVFNTVTLAPGEHTIRIVLKTFNDVWGIEIDQVTLSFDSGLGADDVSCEETTTAAAATTNPTPTDVITTTPTPTDAMNANPTTPAHVTEKEKDDKDKGNNGNHGNSGNMGNSGNHSNSENNGRSGNKPNDN